MQRAGELRQKEVININDGNRLGYVCDVEVSLCKGEIEAIVVPGKMKLLNFSKKDDVVIPWCKVCVIGDVILADVPCGCNETKKQL